MISPIAAAEAALRTCAITRRNSASCWYSHGFISKSALLRHSAIDNAIVSNSSESTPSHDCPEIANGSNHFHHINHDYTAEDTFRHRRLKNRQLLPARRLTKPGMSVCCNLTTFLVGSVLASSSSSHRMMTTATASAELKSTVATSTGDASKSSCTVSLLQEMIQTMNRVEDRIRSSRLSSSTNTIPEKHENDDSKSPPPGSTLRQVSWNLCQTYLNLPPIISPQTMTAKGNGNDSDSSHSKSEMPLSAGGEREQVLQYLCTQCGVDEQILYSAVKRYGDGGRPSDDAATSVADVQRIRQACEPEYERIFRTIVSSCADDNDEMGDQSQISSSSLGMMFLISLREDVGIWIRVLQQRQRRQHNSYQDSFYKEVESGVAGDGDGAEVLLTDLVPKLKQLNDDLKSILSVWFSAGILELRRITYEKTSASIIEKIARKEAVHPFKDLTDLRTRLGPNRRCFAFFHPSLPNNEPLVFVHVALMEDIPCSMQDIDDFHESTTSTTHTLGAEGRNKFQPKTAVFYSITNTQPGLSGVDLGNFLIKRVMKVLRSEFPDSLHTFSTLSPIPKFRKWLEAKLQNSGAGNANVERKERDDNNNYELSSSGKFIDSTLFTLEERELLCNLFMHKDETNTNYMDNKHVIEAKLLNLLDDSSWYQDEKMVKGLEPILMRLAARYLCVEKHRGKPLDGVAKFHVRNGAEMYRLNYLADKSRKGMHNSAGIMINYKYCLDTIEENHIWYEAKGRLPIQEGVSCWLPEN